MNALSFHDRLHLLAESSEELQMQLHGDLSQSSIHDANFYKKRLQHLRGHFQSLEEEARFMNLSRRDELSKTIHKTGQNLKDASAMLERFRSELMGKYTNGPVTRSADKNFQILETTSQFIADEFEANPGLLNHDALDRIGIYCANAEIETQNIPSLKDGASRIADEWFKHASQFAQN